MRLTGHVTDDGLHRLAYVFGAGHGICDGLYPGYYRVYAAYWFYNAGGTLTGKMGEALESSDYSVVADGAPDARVSNSGSGVAGYIYLP